MTYETITIKGNVPSKSNCYKIITIAGNSSLAKTKALKQYEDSFFMQCGSYRNLNIQGYFEFHAKVFYPSMRSDIDNSLKILLDCLQRTKTIKNDNLCVKVVAEKFIDKDCPRVEMQLVTIE